MTEEEDTRYEDGYDEGWANAREFAIDILRSERVDIGVIDRLREALT